MRKWQEWEERKLSGGATGKGGKPLSGKFYYNSSTGRSQWTQPAMWYDSALDMAGDGGVEGVWRCCVRVFPYICVNECEGWRRFRSHRRRRAMTSWVARVCRLKQDRVKCKSADELRRFGFSTEQWEAACVLQAHFRGRLARVGFTKMKKAIVIMQECEALYLNSPGHVPYKVTLVPSVVDGVVEVSTRLVLR